LADTAQKKQRLGGSRKNIRKTPRFDAYTR